MGLAAVPDEQTRLDERVVESSELESVLEERAKAKEKEAMARTASKGFDERAKAMLEEHLGDADEAVIRVGRFRITKSKVPARSVSFETPPASRVRISTVKD